MPKSNARDGENEMDRWNPGLKIEEIGIITSTYGLSHENIENIRIPTLEIGIFCLRVDFHRV
uniref:Uncharacterized protein n=1 Tax=Candidatus Kentrum sp. TC TaxID=2126339 RepID=A0A450YWE7_9GAMM|nr:MAG: hypothetical protein BECKTC1821E_GA0114239_10558 [Candidatus Kentron sp. TC]